MQPGFPSDVALTRFQKRVSTSQAYRAELQIRTDEGTLTPKLEVMLMLSAFCSAEEVAQLRRLCRIASPLWLVRTHTFRRFLAPPGWEPPPWNPRREPRTQN